MKLARWRASTAARGADLAALGTVAAVFVLMFWPALFAGRFLLLADSYSYSLPLRAEVWRMLRDGAPPLWTPHILGGYPLLSMAQLGVGYPLTWGYALLPAHWAEQVYVLAPYLLAPAFAYAYCRQLGRTPLASLLAGLSFGYGGMMFSKYTANGMMTNALMWLPLVLVAIERARATRRFARPVLGVAAAYSMSVLTGIGQGFVYAGALALLYAAFVSLVPRAPETTDHADGVGPDGAGKVEPRHAGNVETVNADSDETARTDNVEAAPPLRSLQRWRPLAAASVGMLLAAGVAAFQILETMRAARRSVRHALSYETFVEGSFTPRLELLSFVAPFYGHEVLDVTAYVASLAVCLAAVGAWAGLRRRDGRRDARVVFWLAVAFVAWLLMLGEGTPLYRLVYHVPVVNRFRVPARHSFEWTFAVSVLAAFGWDALAARARAAADRLASRAEGYGRAPRVRRLAAPLAAFAAALAVFFVWRRAIGDPPPDPVSVYSGLSQSGYLLLKLVFTAALASSFWLGARLASAPARGALLGAVVVLACAAEPYFLKTFWWFPFARTADETGRPSAASQLLARDDPAAQRVYTRVNLFAERQAALDPQNLSVLHGLHNVAGYEPFMLQRFSRALGGVGVDSVNPRPGLRRDTTLLSPGSHVLDLLNTHSLVTFADLARVPTRMTERDGVGFDETNFEAEIKPGAAVSLGAFDAAGDTLALVSVLAGASALEQGAAVARVRVHTKDGRVVEQTLRAGIDTAEWAHERADVRPTIRHSLAPAFDSVRAPGDDFVTHRYLARLALGARAEVARVELSNVSAAATVVLHKATLYDSAARRSHRLRDDPEIFALDASRWRAEQHGGGDLLILRNLRALPRAWLVAEAEAVDGEEALRMIRGEAGARAFDPRRTALVEASADELPPLPGGPPAPGAAARVAYGRNRIDVETESATPALLVVSETFYPGWEAAVDGRPAKIFNTNFLLRGIAVPAGRHRVEMRYHAPAARYGALLSLATLATLATLAFRSRQPSAVSRQRMK